MNGTFMVVSVWRPGPNVSIALPSLKNTASWFSWTINCAPSLMSAEPSGGMRCTSERFDSSKKSMTSRRIAMIWGS